ncbi:MAG: Ig-like domain-containing protein, partial [bacterium]
GAAIVILLSVSMCGDRAIPIVRTLLGGIPSVVSVNPEDGATNVPINPTIIATFSDAMDPATITNGSFLLTDGQVDVPGTVTYSGKVATFIPTSNLDPNVLYTATISNSVQNTLGEAIANNYVWSFTTGVSTSLVEVCGSETFVSDIFTVDTRILGQNGWGANDMPVAIASNFNEKIIKVLAADVCRGPGVWKISNTVTSVGFGNQTCSPALSETAGESFFRSSNGGDTMEVSFFFRTVSSSADGSIMETDLSPPDCSDRFNYMRFENRMDSNGGLTISGIDGVNLDQQHSISNITRGVWHYVKIIDKNVDGLNQDGSANDIINVYVDGVLGFTYSDWEAWRATLPAPSYAVSRVMFRLRGAGTDLDPSFISPEGFYIDDFIEKIYNSSAPSTVISEYRTGFESQ